MNKTAAIKPMTMIFRYCIASLALFSCTQAKVQRFSLQDSIPAAVRFKTSDTSLQRVYDSAEQKAIRNIKNWGDVTVMVEGADYNGIWLETQPMSGSMYAKRNTGIAKSNIERFLDFQRADGRFPGMITFEGDTLRTHFGFVQGFFFPMPALETYYWIGKDHAFLERVYEALEKFDGYLWRVRDSDGDGCLELWCVWDTGEDGSLRLNEFPNAWPFDDPPTPERIAKMTNEELRKYCRHTRPPEKLIVPLESMDVLSYSYTARDVLSRISEIIHNGKAPYWRDRANEVRTKLRSYLWNEDKSACYDRDAQNRTMDILIHNNLRCMYFGSFDQEMADRFIEKHLLDPREFWTPMPLPSIAANDPYFRNDANNNWNGQPQGLTFMRSIRALENYGHLAELTMIGRRFLRSVCSTNVFTQNFDPFTTEMIGSMPDGYGPTLLSALEFISRMYGVYMSEDKLYWTCHDDQESYDYTQLWGDSRFRLSTEGEWAVCHINDTEAFRFRRGIRIVTDLKGNILGIHGVDDRDRKAEIRHGGNIYAGLVTPNGRYLPAGGATMRKVDQVSFKMPDPN